MSITLGQAHPKHIKTKSLSKATCPWDVLIWNVGGCNCQFFFSFIHYIFGMLFFVFLLTYNAILMCLDYAKAKRPIFLVGLIIILCLIRQAKPESVCRHKICVKMPTSVRQEAGRYFILYFINRLFARCIGIVLLCHIYFFWIFLCR